MTKKEFIAKLREKGLPIKPYSIDYAIGAGHVTEPAFDHTGCRVYTDVHIRQMVAYLTTPKGQKQAQGVAT